MPNLEYEYEWSGNDLFLTVYVSIDSFNSLSGFGLEIITKINDEVFYPVIDILNVSNFDIVDINKVDNKVSGLSIDGVPSVIFNDESVFYLFNMRLADVRIIGEFKVLLNSTSSTSFFNENGNSLVIPPVEIEISTNNLQISTNNLPEGELQLLNLPYIGKDIELDFSDISDLDGVNEFSVYWYKDEQLQDNFDNKLDTSIDNPDTLYSAQAVYFDDNGTREELNVLPFKLFDRSVTENGNIQNTSKYIVIKSQGENFFDFPMNIDNVDFYEQANLFSGSNEVETIKVSPGQIFDLTNLKGGVDKIILPGNFEDYLEFSTVDSNSGIITLISNHDFSYTEVKLISAFTASDEVFFENGKLSSTLIKEYLQNKAISNDSPAPEYYSMDELNVNSNQDSIVKVSSFDSSGENFISFTESIFLIVSGSSGVDKVYIREGTSVDATNLKSSVDEIYLQGTWADYTKTIEASGNLLLYRYVEINGVDQLESVLVSSGSTVASNDFLIFADGSIRNNYAVSAVSTENTSPFSSLDGYDGSIFTGLLDEISSTNLLNRTLKDSSLNESLIQSVNDLNELQQYADFNIKHTTESSMNKDSLFNGELINLDNRSIDTTDLTFDLIF